MEFKMNKSILMTLAVLIQLMLCSFASSAYGQYVNVKKTKKLMLPSDVQQESILNVISTEILPTNIAAGESESQIFMKMADKGISYYWKVTPLRQTSIGRAAEAVEENMKVEAGFKDTQNVEHKFNFKILAMQALAKIEYSGWVKAAFNYDAKSEQTKAEIIEAISNNSDIVISHAVQSTENQSELSMRWNW